MSIAVSLENSKTLKYHTFFRKPKNPKISYIFDKTLLLSIIDSKFENEDEKIFKEEEPIKILKVFGLIESK